MEITLRPAFNCPEAAACLGSLDYSLDNRDLYPLTVP